MNVEKIVSDTLKNNGGSYLFSSGERIKEENAWYFPYNPDLTKIIPLEDFTKNAILDFITQVSQYPLPAYTFLGTWLNSNNNAIYLDVSYYVVNKNEAITQATIINTHATRKIVALYNPILNETILLS